MTHRGKSILKDIQYKQLDNTVEEFLEEYNGNPSATEKRNARVVRNISIQADRFPSVSSFGTGSSVQAIETDAGGSEYGTVECHANSLGRSFNTKNTPCVAGKTYVFSFEILEYSDLTASSYFARFYATDSATLEFVNGTGQILTENITQTGRYCVVARCLVGGTINWQFGVGIAGNRVDDYMKLKDLQVEEFDSTEGINPSEYVYASYSTSFNYEPVISVDENGFVTEGVAKTYYQKSKYSNILAVGDSRTDELDEIGGLLGSMLRNSGVGFCSPHASGGWTTGLVIGPVVITADGFTGTYTLDKALDGTFLKIGSGASENYKQYKNFGSPFDTLLVSNLGVNDINVSVDPIDVMANIEIIVSAGVKRGLNIVITSLTPWGTYSSHDSTKQAATLEYNRLLENYCNANGYLFIDIYSPLEDPANPDDLLPAFDSGDGLHPNPAGSYVSSRVIAQKLNPMAIQVEALSFHIPGSISNGDIDLVLEMPYGGEVEATISKLGSGTATITPNRTSGVIGSTANSGSTTANKVYHASASYPVYTFEKGERVYITISSASSASDLTYQLIINKSS